MVFKQTPAEPVREVIGIFFDIHNLEKAIGELKAQGFERDSIGLLASRDTVREKLGRLFHEVHGGEDTESGPRTAFVIDESVGDVVHGIVGSLVLIGATVAGGAVVMSAGILGGALATACAGAAAVAGIGAVLAGIIHESDAEYLEEQIDMGHILLFVRTFDGGQERNALDILSRHSVYDAKVYSVKQSLKSKARHVVAGMET